MLESDVLHAHLVEDVMTREPFTTRESATLLSASRTLRRRHISGLPVVDSQDRVVGVLSERDVVRELHRASGVGTLRGVIDLVLAGERAGPHNLLRDCLRHLERTPVSAAMARRLIVVEPSATLGEAAHLMRQHGVNRLPVTDEGKLVGIVTRQDLVDVVATERRGTPVPVARRFRRAAVPVGRAPAAA